MPALIGRGEGMGSNAWAVAGSRTTTGRPLLANDPHLAVGQPGHLDPEQPALPLGLAGLPPRRQRLLVRRRARRRHRPQRRDRLGLHQPRPGRHRLLPRARRRRHLPARRRLGARSRPARRSSRSPAAPTSASPCAARCTARSCPTSSRASATPVRRAPTEQEGDETEAYAVSLAWTGLIPSRTADAILDLNLATDFEGFREAASSFAVPAAEHRLRRPEGPHRLPGSRSGAGAPPGAAALTRRATGPRPAGTRPTTGRGSSSSRRCRGRSTPRTASSSPRTSR